MKRSLYPFLLSALLVAPATAQVSRLGHDINYRVEASGTVANGDYAPLWFSANSYGLSSTSTTSGYLRAAAIRPDSADADRRWRIGYGVDLAVPLRFTSRFVVQQLYADFHWRALSATVGSREYAPELKNAALSSGGLTFSGNARPIPQVRLSVPDFWTVPGTKGWLALKGHVAYGLTTDANWQESFCTATQRRGTRILYHSKAAFWRIGNETRFPLSFTGGIEMQAQFGGKIWNMGSSEPTKLFNGISSFWHAFIPGGHDVTDGDYPNVEGNQVGSWHFSLDYKGKGWGLRAYGEHFFEDHSQMFIQYGWKDMLWGVEAQLPKNPILSTLVYEHLGTMDQSGPVYHDANDDLPVQVSGTDNYYNHGIYGGWQHWGQGIGNPLIVSPLYRPGGGIAFRYNRVKAHHVGLQGQPLAELSYRLLFSHLRTLGTYGSPTVDPVYANFFRVDLSYRPHWCHGLTIEGSYGTNGGALIGHSRGAMLTLRKTGLLRK
jgi:hypothetical protein